MKETVSFCKEYVTPAIICYQFEVKSTCKANSCPPAPKSSTLNPIIQHIILLGYGIFIDL